MTYGGTFSLEEARVSFIPNASLRELKLPQGVHVFQASAEVFLSTKVSFISLVSSLKTPGDYT